MAASPTIGDEKALNKLARQLKSLPVNLQFWPVTGPLRIIGFPDASYRNNGDGSSQKGMTVFLAGSREKRRNVIWKIDFESQRIEKTVPSTIVAELYSFMKCFGSCQFLRDLRMDISGEVVNFHMRIDAKNQVTRARTIHLPEQNETSHMISMLRKEACSGSTHDLAHMPTQNCLADCFSKASAKADNLIKALKTGRLLDVDIHPNLITLMEHKGSLSPWYTTFMHTRKQGCSLPECCEDFSRTNSTRRIISSDVCGD